MPKFKPGDRVKVIHEKHEYPGLTEEMKNLLKVKRVFTIKRAELGQRAEGSIPNTYCFEEDPDQFWWSEKWMVLETPLSPEEQFKRKEKELISKINTLWTRSDYYKEYQLTG